MRETSSIIITSGRIECELRDPGLGLRDLGLRLRDPGLGLRDPGLGLRDPGLGLRNLGLGLQDPGLGLREPGSQILQHSQSLVLSNACTFECVQRRAAACGAMAGAAYNDHGAL